MPSMIADVLLVEAGVAGTSIAVVLARSSLEVLLLERQRSFRDRVRREYKSQSEVLEAPAVGLEAVIHSTYGVDARFRRGIRTNMF